jgi:hypothetical protein
MSSNKYQPFDSLMGAKVKIPFASKIGIENSLSNPLLKLSTGMALLDVIGICLGRTWPRIEGLYEQLAPALRHRVHVSSFLVDDLGHFNLKEWQRSQAKRRRKEDCFVVDILEFVMLYCRLSC